MSQRRRIAFSARQVVGSVACCVALACGTTHAKPTVNKHDAIAARIELGRTLFFDTRLSASGQIACASCHDPNKAFSDAEATAIGHERARGTRNTPSLLASARMTRWSWDGRRTALAQQVVDPFFAAGEHALGREAELLRRVADDMRYREQFERAFPPHAAITIENIGAALAAYVTTLASGRSRYDRYARAPTSITLTAAERRGMKLFNGRGGCARCHENTNASRSFSDSRFHMGYTGLPAIDTPTLALMNQLRLRTQTQLYRRSTADPAIARLGAFVATLDPADVGKFRTPSLRNVARTAPYMHDGGVATLTEAVAVEAALRSRDARLTSADVDDIVAFLRMLDDELAYVR